MLLFFAYRIAVSTIVRSTGNSCDRAPSALSNTSFSNPDAVTAKESSGVVTARSNERAARWSQRPQIIEHRGGGLSCRQLMSASWASPEAKKRPSNAFAKQSSAAFRFPLPCYAQIKMFDRQAGTFLMCRRNEASIVDPSILIEAAVLAYHIPKQLGHDLTSPAAAAVRDMRSKPALLARFPYVVLIGSSSRGFAALGSPNNVRCFAISFDRLPEHGPNSRRLHFRQTARILTARSPTLVRQSGTAAVSLSLSRPATTFCIIAINRFCSALLRPSSVS